MIGKWLAASLATLVLWGLWGVVLKKASEELEWYQVYVYSNLSIIIVISLLTIIYNKNLIVPPSRANLAIIAGLFGTLGYIFLILSLRLGGKASIVIPLTGLYPAVTAALSYVILSESLSAKKVAGIILALIAIILISD